MNLILNIVYIKEYITWIWYWIFYISSLILPELDIEYCIYHGILPEFDIEYRIYQGVDGGWEPPWPECYITQPGGGRARLNKYL